MNDKDIKIFTILACIAAGLGFVVVIQLLIIYGWEILIII
jgi:hypothetical protein